MPLPSMLMCTGSLPISICLKPVNGVLNPFVSTVLHLLSQPAIAFSSAAHVDSDGGGGAGGGVGLMQALSHALCEGNCPPLPAALMH
jgi:hypothetical protein